MGAPEKTLTIFGAKAPKTEFLLCPQTPEYEERAFCEAKEGQRSANFFLGVCTDAPIRLLAA